MAVTLLLLDVNGKNKDKWWMTVKAASTYCVHSPAVDARSSVAATLDEGHMRGDISTVLVTSTINT